MKWKCKFQCELEQLEMMIGEHTHSGGCDCQSVLSGVSARKWSIQLERVVLRHSVLSFFPSSSVGEIVWNAEVKWNEQHPDVAVVIFFKDVCGDWVEGSGYDILCGSWTSSGFTCSPCSQNTSLSMPLWSASTVFYFVVPLFSIYVPGTPLKAVFNNTLRHSIVEQSALSWNYGTQFSKQ